MIAGEDPSEDEFEVTRILDARINRQYRGSRLQLRVAWRGWPDDPTWYNADDGEFDHAKNALNEFMHSHPPKCAAPVLPEFPRPPLPLTSLGTSLFSPGGVVLRAAGPLHVPYLHVPYKHLSYAPEPVTLHSLSCTCTLVQVTSLKP